MNDNRQYLQGFFTTPQTPLDTTDNQYAYGAWIFNEFLKTKWDVGTILSVWLGMDAEGQNDPIDSITKVLADKGSSFKEAFTLFRVKNYAKKGFYKDADVAQYAAVPMVNSETPFSLDSSTSALPQQTTSVNHLASKYYVFKPNPSETKALDLVTTVDGADGKAVTATVVAKKTDGSFVEYPISLDDTTKEGSVTVPSFTSLSEAVLVLVNYSKAAGDDNTEIKFSAQATASATGAAIDLAVGWNLIDLYVEPDNNAVGTLFSGIKADLISVWKWTNNSWAVYLPGETDGGAAYAQSKGFSVLSGISSGEGFWVNANKAAKLSVSGSQPATTSISVSSGWNLVGLKANQAKSVANLISGHQGKIVSVWKWLNNSWAVHLPGETDGGSAYAGSKGFAVLSDVNPGEGFWVNATQAAVLP
ncbi:MAG: hypothetical protein Q8P24_06550 [Desulfobacterales bacterium]|nr:hypothetical protein [Desulfobacterales bacterium]